MHRIHFWPFGWVAISKWINAATSILVDLLPVVIKIQTT